MEQSDSLVIAFSLATLTYFLSPVMMNFHKKEFVAWGIILRNDALVAMVAIGSVSLIRLLLEFVQQLITQSAGSSLTTSGAAYTEVMAQLTGIEVALVAVMTVVSAIPLPSLQGIVIILGHVLGPAISASTGAIILWVVLQSLSNIMPALFLTMFSSGLVLWSIPFRVGRGVGSYLMALAMVLFVGLQLAAPAAIWLENYVLTSSDLNDLSGLADRIPKNNPIPLGNFIAVNIVELVSRVVAGMIVALIVFPALFLAMLGVFTRAIANLIGGSSGGFSLGV